MGRRPANPKRKEYTSECVARTSQNLPFRMRSSEGISQSLCIRRRCRPPSAQQRESINRQLPACPSDTAGAEPATTVAHTQLLRQRATAVHDKYLSGNEIRLGEERDRSGNILGRACLPQWGATDIVLIKGLAGEADGARGHAVDRDLGGQGARQTARQHDHSRLGDAVVSV